MKRIVRLTERDLTRIVKRVLNEQGDATPKDRNNPRWKNLFNTLKNVNNPKILTFNSYEGVPSQSLNWGSAKTKGAPYALGILSFGPDLPNEDMMVFANDEVGRYTDDVLLNWWRDRGYTARGTNVNINYDDADKLASDLKAFFAEFK
jgi:hypothetical protein